LRFFRGSLLAQIFSAGGKSAFEFIPTTSLIQYGFAAEIEKKLKKGFQLFFHDFSKLGKKIENLSAISKSCI
jgi:hypothetical protein